MNVHGPDGRVWAVSHRPEPPGALRRLLPGGQWLVEAVTTGEVRRWQAPSRRVARAMTTEVALAIRTGSAGPAGEFPPEVGPVRPVHRDEVDQEDTGPGEDAG